MFFRKHLKTRLFRVFGRFWPFFDLFLDIYALRKCILGRKRGKKGVFAKIVFFGFLCFPFFSKKHVFSVFYALFYIDFLRIMNYKLEKHINIKLVFSVLKTHFWKHAKNTYFLWKTRVFWSFSCFFGLCQFFWIICHFFSLFVCVFLDNVFCAHQIIQKRGENRKKDRF